jgi:hypothetical protein
MLYSDAGTPSDMCTLPLLSNEHAMLPGADSLPWRLDRDGVSMCLV